MQRVNEAELPYRGGDSGVKYLFRGPNLDWGVILLLPGQTLGAHYHRQVEETFYVVEGQPRFEVNGASYTAEPGHAFRMEPNDRHDIYNESAEPVRLIFIKHPYLPDDKVDA